MWEEFKNLAGAIYPQFVVSRKPWPIRRVPVFSFHDVTPEKFEAQLEFLASNGYRSILTREYFSRDGATKGDRVVMLTFDDGRASLWNVAYPLLKKYDMLATAFILPGEIREADAPRTPTMSTDPGGDDLCTWPEIIQMTDTLDIQSHSYHHGMVFVGKKVECFFSPRIRDNWKRIDLPIPRRDNADDLERNYPLGAPFYEMDSFFSEKPRMIEPESVRKAMGEYVARNGGEDFFKKNEWENELRKVHDELAKDAEFRFETPERMSKLTRKYLFDSRQMIEGRIRGHIVNSLCLPFGIGDTMVAKYAFQTGYKIIFWGADFAPEKVIALGIWNSRRIKDDYIFRLPGKGRHSLMKTISEKAFRRWKSAY